MREFIIKHFALNYHISLFGRLYSAPRASRIIFPLLVITGYFSVTNINWPTPTFFVCVLYFLLSLALFFGFVYFRFYPVQWEELDNLQKYQYGSFQCDKLSTKEFKEFLTIINKLRETHPELFN